MIFCLFYILHISPLRKKQLDFIINDINITEGSVRSLFTGNSFLKGPIGFKQNPNFLANPINNISFKPAKHFTSSQENGGGQKYKK